MLTFKHIPVGSFIISSVCIFFSQGVSSQRMCNICIYLLCRSFFVFFDDIGLQAIFSHKKNILLEKRYHIYSLYLISVSSYFDIYNV